LATAAGATLADLDRSTRLLTSRVTAIIGRHGRGRQPNLTPVWFDYDGDIVLLNLATTQEGGLAPRTPSHVRAHETRRNAITG